MAEIIAIPTGTFSRGNSSRMIANASGKTAPPIPWTTRPAIITPIVVASAAISVPRASTASTTTSVRFLPNMSPMRPAMGVATDALSRYAVMIQAPAVGDAFRSSSIVPSAGMTSDCSRANAAPASASTAKVTL